MAKKINGEIFPNHTNLKDFSDQQPTTEVKSIFFASGFIPIIGYFIIAAFARQKRKFRNNSAFARSKKAFKLAKIKLDLLASTAYDSKVFVQELSQIIREYIGDKLNLNGAAFTTNEAISKLKERQIPTEQIIPMQDLLETLERIQYGGPKSDSNLSDRLINQSLETLKKLEKLS